MKTTVKLVAAAVVAVALAMGSQAKAASLNYVLEIDPAGTWELSAWTDATGGIGSIVADLENVTGGASVAPEGITIPGFAVRGFNQGNVFAGNQAFAGQSTTVADNIVYGIGFEPLEDSVLGTDIAKGEGNIGTIPVLFYTGTFDPSGPLPAFADSQPEAAGSVFLEVGDVTSVSRAGGTEFSYETTVIPEPAGFILAGLAIPALAFAIRRRKVA